VLFLLPAICLAQGPNEDQAPPVDRVAYQAAEAEPVEPPDPEEAVPAPAPADEEEEPPARLRRWRRNERAPRSNLSSMLASTAPIARLASVPNMFGDSFAHGGMIQVCRFQNPETEAIVGHGFGTGYDPSLISCTYAMLPPVGGGWRNKIAENNRALPSDRVFFNYNHYENALTTGVQPGSTRSRAVDQYTIGVEKTFHDGLCSLEIRQPFIGTHHANMEDLGFTGGEVGNLGIGVKHLLLTREHCMVGVGLGIEVPTGNGLEGAAAGRDFKVYNDAVYLAPWIGFMKTHGDARWFCTGFLQMNLAANGNRVSYDGNSLGRINEQNLLYFDLAMGYWLCSRPDALRLRGMALVAEYHYTTTVQDADIVNTGDSQTMIGIGNPYNRTDVSNATIGLHTIVGKSTLGLGVVLPLQNDANRMFDAEIQFFFNRFW